MILLPVQDVLRAHHIGERAARVKIRDNHLFVRADNARRFGHKMHAAKKDNVGFCLGRFLRQFQGISREIGNILDFAALIIMGHQNGIPLFFERDDFFFDRFKNFLRH